ncbi:uncharacterized protein DNG_01809 [Cephalotrichum gorgonifer]|uniref:Uncharacterized protein n=1 Tax=Cephalotrichum gorgonifer TaxID=2041049 RepID=A0AAE8SS51_9PEZI|nr:uncharacterized protein DNG_01809 [Cephalotrichum gorgonifer]
MSRVRVSGLASIRQLCPCQAAKLPFDEETWRREAPWLVFYSENLVKFKSYDLLKLGSASSSSSSSSTDSLYGMDIVRPPVASVQIFRCMRCARTQEATSTDDYTSCGMVRIGEGIYYCQRCAKSVGYT